MVAIMTTVKFYDVYTHFNNKTGNLPQSTTSMREDVLASNDETRKYVISTRGGFSLKNLVRWSAARGAMACTALRQPQTILPQRKNKSFF